MADHFRDMRVDPVAGADADVSSAEDTSEVALLLARFPGPVALHSSRFRYGLLLAGSLAFVAVAAWLLHRGTLSDAATIKVWISLAIFGCGALIAAAMLLPGAGSLTLDAEGFERVTLYVKSRTSWRQVDRFMVGAYAAPRTRKVRFVGYDDARKPADNMTRRMSGRNAALPDTYGLAHAELASLMTQWRARAMAHHARPAMAAPGRADR